MTRPPPRPTAIARHLSPREPRRLRDWIRREAIHYRAALFALTAFLLIVAVLLPFSVFDIFIDVLGVPNGQVHTLVPGTGRPEPGRDVFHVHLATVLVDEAQQSVSFRVSSDRDCADECSGDYQLALLSWTGETARQAGIPSSATVPLRANIFESSITVVLPAEGNPIRYPYDTYDLVLAVGLLRDAGQGAWQPVPRTEMEQRLRVTLNENLTRKTMTFRGERDPVEIGLSERIAPGVRAVEMTFSRPIYLRVLAVALVLMSAAAAVSAVFMRPIHDLFIGSGTLVIGVWGIRGILIPGFPAYLSAVDISLSLVILFLLSAIVLRLTFHLRQQSRKVSPGDADTPAEA